jgi:hypothetical protein
MISLIINSIAHYCNKREESMAINENMTFQAKLEMGQFIVIDRSPDLPALSDHLPLISYLNWLTADHWRVAQISFENFILTAKTERFEPEIKRLPLYLIQMLSQTLASYGLSSQTFTSWLSKDQKVLNDQFSKSIRENGWKELATSKPLSDLSGGIFIFSIWIKE